MGMTLVLQQMIVLFLMMAAGYAANRCRVMSKESEQLFSKLIVNLTCPALIINSVTTSGRLESMGALFAIFGAAAVYYVLLPLLSKGLVRLLRVPAERAAEYESMLVYSNLGFMGIPVANAVLGPDSVLYLSIFMAVFNISVFSYGTLLIQPGEGGKIHFRKMVNPGTVSAVAAILLYLLEVQLPSLILQPVASIGSTTTPLAMLVIGSSLARQPCGKCCRRKACCPLPCCGCWCCRRRSCWSAGGSSTTPCCWGRWCWCRPCPSPPTSSCCATSWGGTPPTSPKACFSPPSFRWSPCR